MNSKGKRWIRDEVADGLSATVTVPTGVLVLSRWDEKSARHHCKCLVSRCYAGRGGVHYSRNCTPFPTWRVGLYALQFSMGNGRRVETWHHRGVRNDNAQGDSSHGHSTLFFLKFGPLCLLKIWTDIGVLYLHLYFNQIWFGLVIIW